MTGLQSRFDWYEATADDDPDGRTAPSLALALGAQLGRGKARNGYAECWQLERGGELLAEVYGRSARLGEVHISVTSESCDEVVPVLRRMWPGHRVSRADSAVDLAADFEALATLTKTFADDRGLTSMSIRNSEGGATLYVGSPRSEVQLRLYKKSEQLKQLHPEKADEIQDGIVRFELVTRPGKRVVKEAVANMHPDDVWGLAKWSRELARLVLAIDAPRVATHFRRPANYTRSLHFLGVQYGGIMRARAAAVGTAQAVRELTEALGL
jgi:hypothetical protein